MSVSRTETGKWGTGVSGSVDPMRGKRSGLARDLIEIAFSRVEALGVTVCLQYGGGPAKPIPVSRLVYRHPDEN